MSDLNKGGFSVREIGRSSALKAQCRTRLREGLWIYPDPMDNHSHEETRHIFSITKCWSDSNITGVDQASVWVVKVLPSRHVQPFRAAESPLTLPCMSAASRRSTGASLLLHTNCDRKTFTENGILLSSFPSWLSQLWEVSWQIHLVGRVFPLSPP